MANPDFLDVLGDEMGNVYAAAHDRLLINLARHFKYVKDEIISGPNASFQYQARKLAELGQVNRESVDIIMKMMGGGDQALRDSLEAAILDSLDDLEPALIQAAREGLLNGGTVPPEVPVRSMQAFQSYYKQSADKMNLVNSNMLRSTANAYRATVSDIASRMQQAQRIVNAATGQLIVGADSFNAILKDATAKMVQNGITGLVDDGGHRWAPETYISMVMRTTFHNASREAFFERNAEYTNDLYLVSQHPGARPLCYPWQCKVISRTDNARDVEDGNGQPVHVYAQSETTYGEPAGLFGINCGHYPLPFIPGATKVPEVRQDEEENAKQYAESQKQRGLEREFRKARLDLDVAKAQGADKETIEAAKAKIRRADEKLNRFCNETGRKRRREREYAPVNAKWPEERQSRQNTNSGAVSGAKKTPGWQDRHAERYYEEVRHRKPGVDASKIAKHTEFTEEQAEDIRQHMFIREQPLEHGTKIDRFAPDYDQAQAWQRLTEGRGTETDILMLKHEYLELTEMRKHGYNYDEAHEIANRTFNWWEAVLNGGKGGQ